MFIPWWEVALRLGLAALLGGLIGWDRELRHKPAGLRTIMLVSLSSAVYALAAMEAAARRGEALDAVRAMSGIAQGIGFLGAGAILQSRGQVRWLTTAAALWAAAAIGFAMAMGSYVIGVGSAVLVFAILHWMPELTNRLVARETATDKATQPPESTQPPDES